MDVRAIVPSWGRGLLGELSANKSKGLRAITARTAMRHPCTLRLKMRLTLEICGG